ncbi:hypothetical protein B0H12DRAFT_1163189 [Mycena haematopus]|nr:hypothetical protein B0H12DRAFT_1163189 [Mycena haematopus]
MMPKFTSFVLSIAIAVMAVAAASIPRDATLSTCGQAVEGLLSSGDPGIQCLAPAGLTSFLSLSSRNASVADVKGAVDGWLTDFCGVGSCRCVHNPVIGLGFRATRELADWVLVTGSADTLTHIGNNITAGCGDVGDFNTTNFEALRGLLCLKDTTANSFCTTESLLSNGTVSTFAPPEDLMLGLLLASSTLGATCNECTKAQYQQGLKTGDSDTEVLTEICGANFTATLNSTAVGIEEVTTPKNGARALAPTVTLLIITLSGLFVSL